MKIAVVTGASSGMGREFVFAVDKEFDLDEIWVIARREERFVSLSEKCRSKIRPLAWDLSEKNSFEKCGTIYVADGSPRIAYQWSKN